MNKQLLKSVLRINHRLAALRCRVHWPPAWGRGRRLLATVALALCLGMPGLALINDIFSDVPASAFYHDAVKAIYRAGITVGCSAGLYCPDQAVTRGQMAAFLHRGLPRVAYNDPNTSIALERGLANEVAAVTINTGGAPGQTGFIKFDGTFFINPVSGCPCHVSIDISGEGKSSNKTAYVSNSFVGGAMTWVVAVPTGTTQTFRLRMAILFSSSLTPDVVGQGQLSAIYVPFGSTGTSTLAAQPADEQLPAAPSDHQPELLAPLIPELPMKKKTH